MDKKGVFVVVGIVFIGFVLIVLLIALILLFPILIVDIGLLLLPNPDKPRVTYGEFPFEITYEINGEVKTVSDVYVCKYDGTETNYEDRLSNKQDTYYTLKEKFGGSDNPEGQKYYENGKLLP